MYAQSALRWIPLAFALPLFAACAKSEREAGEQTPANTEPATPAPTGTFDPNKPAPAEGPAEIAEIFGHSADTLYKLDPLTKAVTEVGTFSGCASIIDIALDGNSNLYATSYSSLYRVDRTTGHCTEIATGDYPNSLSFVPKGTVDATDEALVGYDDADYWRIDVTTGQKTKIGTLGVNGLKSSGDIVSVKGGKTYLTVKGTSQCNAHDCLVEIDPTTGKVTKNWGSVEHSNVFGLSFWGGKVYGFDDAGELFEVTFGTSQLATTPIAIPSKPANLSFWGAGSTTSAPLVAKPQ